jgi:hypothetical protein
MYSFFFRRHSLAASLFLSSLISRFLSWSSPFPPLKFPLCATTGTKNSCPWAYWTIAPPAVEFVMVNVWMPCVPFPPEIWIAPGNTGTKKRPTWNRVEREGHARPQFCYSMFNEWNYGTEKCMLIKSVQNCRAELTSCRIVVRTLLGSVSGLKCLG